MVFTIKLLLFVANTGYFLDSYKNNSIKVPFSCWSALKGLLLHIASVTASAFVTCNSLNVIILASAAYALSFTSVFSEAKRGSNI